MIIPIRCFTCGRVMADISDYYEKEKSKIDETKEVDPVYKNFEKIANLYRLSVNEHCRFKMRQDVFLKGFT